ncbi:MAG TPA: DUF1223 domain-containing protein [Steroidobacteraceae bacterium]|nr:DUF1223 domain-containing protein [Steroidobacteraceae bacterium]
MKTPASLAFLMLATGSALAAPRPVVVELFTSLGCSDCPPADSMLANVRDRVPGVLVLDMHVTYWNNLSWRDPYSLSEVDQRQKDYAALRGGQQVYTPEAFVDGQQPFIGSDARAMAAALNKARASVAADPGVSVTIGSSAHNITVQVGPGSGKGVVWLFGFDPEHSTPVHGGENAGATIKEVNVVRSITRLGKWRGQPLQLGTRAPPGSDFAVILQGPDGTVLGAASSRTPAA